MTITHRKVSAVADSADTGLVRPSDWNDTHTGTLVHGSDLTSLTADDHTQYLLLAGRAGSQDITDDITISGFVRIGSNSDPVNTTAGDLTAIRALIGGDAVFDGDARTFRVIGGLTSTAAATELAWELYTTSTPSGASSATHVSGQIVAHKLGANSLATLDGVRLRAIIDAGDVTTVNAVNSFLSFTNAAAVSVTTARVLQFAILSRTGSGTLTINTLTGVAVLGPTGLQGSDAITTEIGVDVANLGDSHATTSVALSISHQSGSGTNLGLRNSSTSSFPSQTQALGLAGDTITATSTFKHLTNSTGASLTLTSAPTIANGVDGQIIVLMNGDSADDIVLQDQGTLAGSNLRLAGAANFTMTPMDTLTLIYSGVFNDWVEIMRSVN